MASSLVNRPVPGYTQSSGPSLVAYSTMLPAMYKATFNQRTWPAFAEMLFDVDAGNSTLAAPFFDQNFWNNDPTTARLSSARRRPSWKELKSMVVCSDSYSSTPLPPSPMDWWDGLWSNMTEKTWLAGDTLFFSVLPCRPAVRRLLAPC
ncbi:hypothetical protein QQS21_007909 [Conoideocrella luteorostrata]|uniref:Uncharacterized protein n=1 Tax=Conoideocrella luteorostrata TaxID=1105319 RepID=A0AAJ0FX02_9HYPO|nr:hypothetical protein QQS21_007909 [Conoideocrella luteorostrata]